VEPGTPAFFEAPHTNITMLMCCRHNYVGIAAVATAVA